MRITRAALHKVAKDTVSQRVRTDRTVICVYLTGSLLEEDPLIGGVTDIDLVFIHDGESPLPRETIRITDEIHLDISHLSQTVFHHPRRLRADPWVGSYLCANPLCLHDVQHWFEFTQASAAAQFFQADNVLTRARSFAETARQSWLGLHLGQFESHPEKVYAYLRTLEKAANAIACLTGAPLTERRFWLRFPERAKRINCPELAETLIPLFMPEVITESTWTSWLEGWKNDLSIVSKIPSVSPSLSSCRQLYYEKAAVSLFGQFPLAAAWVVMRTWTKAVCSVSTETASLQIWKKACQDMQLDEDCFEQRTIQLDAYLDSIEETLDQWGEVNGIS